MRALSRLRVVLATLALLGAFHLHADAAPGGATSGPCEMGAYEIGWQTCEWMTGGEWEWGIVYYSENPDGSCDYEVECY